MRLSRSYFCFGILLRKKPSFIKITILISIGKELWYSLHRNTSFSTEGKNFLGGKKVFFPVKNKYRNRQLQSITPMKRKKLLELITATLKPLE